jgi:imidazolonepropionase-like amidohydrolase
VDGFQQEGSEGATAGGGAGGSSTTSLSDNLWEKVRAGELPVIINANSAAAILHVLKIVKPAEKAKVLLVANAADLYQVRESLAGSRVHVIVRPRLEKVSNSAVRFNVARELSQRSIPFSFSVSANQADFRESQDTPLFPVATLVKTGLDADQAVQALTLHPAKALGIDQWVGSLEAGKQANLLVFDRDPLTDVGRLEQVHVGGKLVYENR